METFKQFFEVQSGVIVAYHGTPHGLFDKFDASKRGEGADQGDFGNYGNGFYFTIDKAMAIRYAKKLTERQIGNQPYLYTVNLRIFKPFSFDRLRNYEKDFWDTIKANHAAGMKHGLINISSEQENAIMKKYQTTEDEIEFMKWLESKMNDNWEDVNFAQILKKKRYDSVVIKGGEEIVVFDEHQIQIIKREPV
jgi:hypothetical protein